MAKSSATDKTRTASGTSPSTESPLSFEESMTGLQEIVNDLEENSLGLEASLAHFERGIGLLRNCHALLEKAEQKIEILTGFKSNGEPATAPFDATPTAGHPESKTLF